MYRVVAGICFSAQAKKGNKIMKFFDLELGGLGATTIIHSDHGGDGLCYAETWDVSTSTTAEGCSPGGTINVYTNNTGWCPGELVQRGMSRSGKTVKKIR